MKYMERMAKINCGLEMELGITGTLTFAWICLVLFVWLFVCLVGWLVPLKTKTD